MELDESGKNIKTIDYDKAVGGSVLLSSALYD